MLNRLRIWLILVAAIIWGAGLCDAASLTNYTAVHIGNNSSHNISVYPGKAGYSGLASGVFSDGTVVDYRFYNNATISSGGYADGPGAELSDITTGGGLTDYNMDYADVWTTTDPGTLDGNSIPDFSTAADFEGSTKTMSGQQVVDGTIDISSLVTGNVYVLCGHYSNPFTVTLTMNGAGQPDLMKATTVDPPNSRNKYILQFDFHDPSNDYTTISYNYTGGAGNRSRYMGVIVDGEAPAGEIQWSGPQTLAIGSSNATASATHTEDLTEHVLAWDTSDRGDTNTTDWTYSRSLGPHSAGPTSGELTGLIADTAYTWRLYGSNALSQAWTEAQAFATDLTDAQAPVFTNATVTASTLGVTLGWQDNAATETGYVLRRSADGTNYTTIAELAADVVTYADRVPLPGTYHYAVSATNRSNGSDTGFARSRTNLAVEIPALYVNSTVRVSNNSDFNLSVYPGAAAYDGDVAGVFGDGDVLAYEFARNGSAPGIVVYAEDESDRMTGLTNQSFTTFADFDRGDVWTTANPGPLTNGIPLFSTSADFGGSTATISGGYNVRGNVDISGIGEGLVYLLVGGYDNPFTVTTTMTGAGQPERTADVTIDPPTTRNLYIIEVPFLNVTGGYDTIAYTYTGSASNRSRFMGVILDSGPLPPDGLILLIR